MTKTPHPIPETGGSWSRDPKTGALTQIEEPTVHPVPEAAPDAEAPPAGETTAKAATPSAAPETRKG